MEKSIYVGTTPHCISNGDLDDQRQEFSQEQEQQQTLCDRPIEVHTHSFLDQVSQQFRKQPQVFDEFIHIMKEFATQMWVRYYQNHLC